MQRHTRDQIRYQRRKHVSHRLRFLRRAWRWVPDHPGKLSKWNLGCSCWVCRDPKYRDQRAEEERRWRDEVQKNED